MRIWRNYRTLGQSKPKMANRSVALASQIWRLYRIPPMEAMCDRAILTPHLLRGAPRQLPRSSAAPQGSEQLLRSSSGAPQLLSSSSGAPQELRSSSGASQEVFRSSSAPQQLLRSSSGTPQLLSSSSAAPRELRSSSAAPQELLRRSSGAPQLQNSRRKTEPSCLPQPHTHPPIHGGVRG